jgi:predicted metal-dependent phosphoesterase TrpH
MIDLHVHSTFSDGSLTPEQLIEEARRIGLSAIALTDHDGMMGIERFLKAGQQAGIETVPGVEISVEVSSGTLHMLGYYLDRDNITVVESLALIRGGREDRNKVILDRLNRLGAGLAWEDVAKFAGEDVVGRPHFAQAMVEKGFVKDKQDAFDRYLAKGKAAYVDRFRLSVEESVRMIRGAGGVAVLAHPSTLDLGTSALRDMLVSLKAVGLQGVEAYYSEHSPAQTDLYLRLAAELGLLVTGGSDFHGDVNPHIKLGRGFGQLAVPDNLLGPIRDCGRRH